MLVVVFIILASCLCDKGLGLSEADPTRGLLYLLKYGYLSPRNQTSALLTAEGLQESWTSSISSCWSSLN